MNFLSVRGCLRTKLRFCNRYSSTFKFNGKEYEVDEVTNVTTSVLNKTNLKLHKQSKNPICILSKLVTDNLQEFVKFEYDDPVVSVKKNFDDLLFPSNHPGRSRNDTYYLNSNYMLRSHTSSYEIETIRKLYQMDKRCGVFTADVYRRDEIDKTHYPVFHQTEFVKLCLRDEINVEKMGEDLKRTVMEIIKFLFSISESIDKEPKMRWVDAYFPFTDPSWELEIMYKGTWLEILGCGILRDEVLRAAGRDDFIGWASGTGLERLCMTLFDIPDVRLFWSNDARFRSQFESDRISKFFPFSKYPQIRRDMSFWIPERYERNSLLDIIREICGDNVEEVKLTENRVKSISLHPKCHWILVSFHNGLIRLYDYVSEILLEEFKGHEGPVRSVSFHKTLSLFVSGSDDHLVKVWDWRLRRPLFDLKGHTDYVRTTFFHDENPWIVSASDDQTIRIWNWQSRTCIAVLTGHNHYVMCAQFHPVEDLVVSASLDQTARVWNIAGLKNSNVSNNSASADIADGSIAQGLIDSIIGIDLGVKFVLEGHENGVNWVEFHATQPLILTASDDKTIRLWRMSGSQVWETDVFRGHTGNVSSAVFDRSHDIIISNSEDKSLKVWSFRKRTALSTIKKENSRFWTLAKHPTFDVYAAGHDNGFFVFKLERARPAFQTLEKSFMYVNKRNIEIYEYASNESRIIYTLPSNFKSTLGSCNHISYNASERAILISFHGTKSVYQMYSFKNHDFETDCIPDAGELFRGTGAYATFISKSKFAVLDKSSLSQIIIKNLSNVALQRINLELDNAMSIHYLTGKDLLLVTKDSLLMYDTDTLTVSSIYKIDNVSLVYPSPHKHKLALITPQNIVIINTDKFKLNCTLQTDFRVKSGAWYDDNVFVFNDAYHIKYLLSNGDSGILMSLMKPVYIVRIIGNKLVHISSNFQVNAVNIDFTECIFKFNVIMGNKDIVQKMITSTNLVGQSIIGYLREKGYPDIPLNFIKDPRSKFDMSISCKNFEVALATARKLKDPDVWEILGQEAFKNGNIEIAEISFQNNKNLTSLNNLYLVTGNNENLSKMISIHMSVKDYSSAYLNSLLTRDTISEVEVLRECKKPFFAYLAAKSGGDESLAQKILDEHESSKVPDIGSLNLRPGDGEYIGLPISANKDVFNDTMNQDFIYQDEVDYNPIENSIKLEYSGDEDVKSINSDKDISSINDNILTEEKQDWGIDLDVCEHSINEYDENDVPVTNVGKVDYHDSIQGDDDYEESIFQVYEFDYVEKYIIDKLKSEKGILSINIVLPHIKSLSSTYTPLKTSFDDFEQNLLSLKLFEPLLEKAIECTKYAKNCFSKGSFAESLNKFREVLILIAPASVISGDDPSVSNVIAEAAKYTLGISIEIYRRKYLNELTPERNLQLAACLTSCVTDIDHFRLTLRSALSVAKSIKDYEHTKSFAKRLIETDPGKDVTEKVLYTETLNTNAQINILLSSIENKRDEIHSDINFSIDGPNYICSSKLIPLVDPSNVYKCHYCQSLYDMEIDLELCNICQIAQIF